MQPECAEAPVRANLQVFSPDGVLTAHPLKTGRRYTVGRSAAADIALVDDAISRHHIEIDTATRPWQIRDLGSKNGTRIEGRPLDRSAVTRSCWLSLAGIPARLELLDDAAAAVADQQEQTLRNTARRLSGSLKGTTDFEDLVDQALTAFTDLAECDTGALFLADSDHRPALIHSVGSETFAGSRSVVDQVIEDQCPVIVSDVDSVRALAERDSICEGAIRALVCLPLVLAGRQRGAIYADCQRAGKLFTPLDRELLEGLAGQAAFAIALSRMQAEAEHLRRDLPKTPEALASSARFRSMLDRVLPTTS